ncbi:MAG: serpin family protein [Acidimicrobiales bacterium]
MTTDEDDRLSAAFDRYAAATKRVQWTPPLELRRAATARRRRRRAVVGSVSTVVALAVAVSFAALPNTPAHHPGVTKGQAASAVRRQAVAPGSPNQVTVESAEQRFALALTKVILAQAPTSNVVVSPESLATTLSMLELGARGTTEHEIAAALGSSSLNAQQQASGWNALTAQLASDAAAAHVQLVDRNAVFVQQSLNVLTGFKDALMSNYGARVTTVDFRATNGSAINVINNWVQQVTGAASPLFGPGSLSSSTELVMADAMRFSAAWGPNVVFPARLTSRGEFVTTDGHPARVPMMKLLTADIQYVSSTQMEGVVLPYAGGRFEAVAIEPTTGSISSLVSTLTPASLDQLAKNFRVGLVSLTMPTFSVGSNVNLDGTLRALGIADAFNSSADFGGMARARLELEAVAQSDQLSVGRYGTDASAASGAATRAVSSSGHVTTISFDHPFIFVIRDKATGAILFDAVITNPSAS